MKKKILIVKTSALGDIIQAFPVLHYLRAHYPDAQIDWIVEENCAPLLEAHPYLNHAIRINSKKWRTSFWKRESRQELLQLSQKLRESKYDLLFDLQANLKSGLLNALVSSAKKIGFGAKTVHEWPNLLFTTHRVNPPDGKNIREDYLYLAQSTVGNFDTKIEGIKLEIDETEKQKIEKIVKDISLRKAGPCILICTGSNWVNKQLNKETLRMFLELIIKNLSSHFLFVWGSKEEKQLAEQLTSHFSGYAYVVERMGLATLQNLMAEVDLVIAMDSLPLHLAATTSTPTYSVFGASSAKKFKPAGLTHQAFQGVCPYGKTFVKRCPILRTCQTGACMKNIKGEELYNHFITWWKNKKKCNSKNSEHANF